MAPKTFDISIWEKSIDKEYKGREKDRLNVIKKSVKKLKSYFKHKGAKRVFLVGSVLEEGKFYPFSDIDVVVDGTIEEYFKTLSELEELLGRSVDVIEFERCRFKDSIEENGLRII